MKKVLLIVLMNVVVSCISAQRQKPVEPRQDPTILSVTYDVYYQKFEEEPKRKKDLMRLDIGRHSSQYVSVIGEFISKHKSELIAKKIEKPYVGYTTLRDEVYKNTPKSGFMQFIHMPGWVSCREKIEGLFDWQLLKGDSIVCGYPCHKAIAAFRGRVWTVWYTLDLPYGDGPWKLCGLPGLVLEASEAEGKIAFRCKKVEKNTGYGIVLKKKNSAPMLRERSDLLDVYRPEKAAELLMLEQWDELLFGTVMTGNLSAGDVKGDRVFSVVRDGKRISIPSCKTAVLYEIYPDIDIKKLYPPTIVK